jgi:hypothetical protein
MKKKRNTMTFRWESDLKAPILEFLRDRNFKLQQTEVSFYEYRMDVYGYSKQDDLTIAIELKLFKWKRALEQAIIYQLCSDLSYIAMPKSQIHRVDLTNLKTYGIGLISVETNKCYEILKATPSVVLRPHYRSEYISILEEEKLHRCKQYKK